MTLHWPVGRSRRAIVAALALLAPAIGHGAPPVRAQVTATSPRIIQNADADWRFSRGDFASAAVPAFDDARWARVDLPHDWSAGGPFSADLGSGNGYAPGGIAWYRKHLTLPSALEQKVGAIEFDGIYDNSEVWVNGHLACGRPYGYSSFECPLTPFLKFGGADNVIAVRVDHSRFADSRWYTGSGIYRHVRLRFTEPLHIAQWGTVITTPAVTAASATVTIETTVENPSTGEHRFQLLSEILLNGRVVRSAQDDTDHAVPAGGHHTLRQSITVPQPSLWSTDSPTLYTLRQQLRLFRSSSSDPSELTKGGLAVADEVDTTFGIRTIRFDANNGFFLNGQPIKLKGVCLHQDAGSVGVAVPEAVWESRLRALKAIGVNAIRTSHNPPAPEFLDLADRLGFVVKDEAFDEFTPAKNKWVNGWNAGVPSRFGYAEDFAQWSVKDAGDMVRRDRNHPSIVMWSVGNEVDYPNDPFSHPVLAKSYRPANPPAENLVTLAQPLIDVVHSLDTTRPVTMALASVAMSDAVGLGERLDIVGYNYQESRYADDHAKYPKRVIFGSETSHSYENWAIVRDNPYVVGQFLWTGIDYLGEARAFPSRANGAGLFDLAGFKKPLAWFRQSLWSSTPMVYLAAAPAGTRAANPEERWNWPPGSTMTVWAYTNAADVELTLNGQSLGTEHLTDAKAGVLTWNVPYAPGALTATAKNAGKTVADFTLRTAGAPKRLELVEDTSAVLTGNAHTRQIEFRIVDDAGVRVSGAEAEVTFEVGGPARVLGIGNGDLANIETGATSHRTFQGRGRLILGVTDPTAAITVTASSPGLAAATLTLQPGKRD